MPAPDAISCDKLAKLIGTPRAPVILDVRRAAVRRDDPRAIPGARLLDETALNPADALALVPGLRNQAVVVICAAGHARSQGLAAVLRTEGIAAEYLEGGQEAWVAAGLQSFDPSKLGRRDDAGRSLWVTRSRPKIDRIACPWLIRRFIDPRAVFLFVAPAEVPAVAEMLGAAAFDVEDTFWSHRGDLCTFDTLLAEFGLRLPALDRLATIVRGADTARPELAPECAGLLAASLGLSRMYADDQAQLDAGLQLYDAFFRWARDATEETHDWPKAGKAK
ncbi:sulfurtransferase/chromate resistance protein [Tabrizicola sp.]|uniref:sulfurtransferase/chromate resistance protein n=1 Tax=Tabrizicola sp. TaxID=2005166 RepID=UPI002736CFA6|nr:sulfurtransferase/chromate resistance protein [Tabrizicola sp.]MDP3193675.1 sulfurtransferase/chromate resistance protein [Tabrizicola sp.]